MSRQENLFLHLYHPLPLPSSVFFSLVVVECPHEEASSRQAWWLLNVVTKKHPAGKVFVPFALIIIARILDKIKDIDGSKETLKLVVRITDLWFVGMPNKSKQAEMIIVDSNGDQIHVVCKRDQLKSWKSVLKENCTHVMHNFKVMKNDGQYRVCDHQYKLVFTGVIVHRQTHLDNVPLKKIQFYSIFQYHCWPLSTWPVGCEQLLSCTLWEDYCLQFLEYLNECQSDGPIIVLLTHARIKEAQGSYPPSVSNSLKASKLVSNEVVDEIQEFKDRLSELGIEVHSVMTPRGQGSSQLSACIQCHKKTDIDTIVFTCACGKYNEQAMLRYRLEVMVSHKEESNKFLFWDHECTNLIGQSADEVNRLKIVDGDVDLNASPEGLDKLLGYVFAFKVKVQPKFRNVVVLKYSRDLSLINTIMELLPDVEASSKIDIAIPDSNDPHHHESQSMSGTADHDPLLGLPLTPTKRQPSQECDDEARSSQISPAQLSSNKLVKHAKIE
ncbi:hypothetical protein JHK82_042931 [Glycine max]|nr:hypothetical protein JHK82_042931 [Glycine max]